MYGQVHKCLVEDAPLRDKVRLQSQAQEHSGAWLSVAPNTNLGTHFDKGDFLLLTHFHLGLRLLPESAAGTPCDRCVFGTFSGITLCLAPKGELIADIMPCAPRSRKSPLVLGCTCGER